MKTNTDISTFTMNLRRKPIVILQFMLAAVAIALAISGISTQQYPDVAFLSLASIGLFAIALLTNPLPEGDSQSDASEHIRSVGRVGDTGYVQSPRPTFSNRQNKAA